MEKATLITHYEMLGIQDNATEAEIKKAYRDKASIWHPDKFPGELIESETDRESINIIWKRIVEAHEILSDETKRKNYDYCLKKPLTLAEIEAENIFRKQWQTLQAKYNDYIKRQSNPEENIKYLTENLRSFKYKHSELQKKSQQLESENQSICQKLHEATTILSRQKEEIFRKDEANQALKAELNEKDSELQKLKNALRKLEETLSSTQHSTTSSNVPAMSASSTHSISFFSTPDSSLPQSSVKKDEISSKPKINGLVCINKVLGDRPLKFNYLLLSFDSKENADQFRKLHLSMFKTLSDCEFSVSLTQNPKTVSLEVNTRGFEEVKSAKDLASREVIEQKLYEMGTSVVLEKFQKYFDITNVKQGFYFYKSNAIYDKEVSEEDIPAEYRHASHFNKPYTL